MTVADRGVRTPADPVGIAGAVRAGRRTASDVAESVLSRVRARDIAPALFAGVDAERLRAEATALDTRADRFALPLAGVPVAVEDGIDVAGRATRHGSTATADTPVRRDDVLVRRLRAAGALVVGTTIAPELGLGRDGAPGGRATAAATGEGLAALSIGIDGDGALRAAAAAHGLLALTPGRRELPLPGGAPRLWSGLAGTTVLAADVDGVRVAFEVLRASRAGAVPRQGTAPGWASPGGALFPPGRAPRPVTVTDGVEDLPAPRAVACSLRSGRGLWADPRSCGAVHAAARRLAESDVAVSADDPPYRAWLPAQVSRRRDAGVARRVDELGLDPDLLGPDVRAALRRDRQVRRLGGPRPASPGRWRQRAVALFDDGGYDVLLLPAPADGEPPACLSAWNLAGLPSLVAPVRWGDERRPVQLVGRAGSERLLLGTAALLEER
ncbi:amidase family protein [Pseudonocardia sediminis]|nr:amidase family protein [Pseudonocardia sediminis]